METAKRISFESSVISYGSESVYKEVWRCGVFESSVISYGSESIVIVSMG